MLPPRIAAALGALAAALTAAALVTAAHASTTAPTARPAGAGPITAAAVPQFDHVVIAIFENHR